MTVDILNVARWEWFKLRYRWMPWILLALFLLVSQIFLWGSFFIFKALIESGGQPAISEAGFQTSGYITLERCQQHVSDGASKVPITGDLDVATGVAQQCAPEATRQQQQLQAVVADFTLPDSIATTLRRSYPFALVLFTLLVASVVGMEYRMGTLRMVLTKGTGRWQYLGGKFLLLAGAAGAALGLLVVTTTVSSLITSGLSFGWPPPVDSGSWGAAAMTWVMAWVSLAPFLALTGLVTVLTRSSTVGTALGVGYYFTEMVLVNIISGLFEWSDTLADYLLVQNMTRLVASGLSEIKDTGTILALVVLIAYWLAFTAAAFWVVQRRDVAGASGE